MKKHNFCAGPCILPQKVFEQTSQAVLDYNGIGLSILEISHRSEEFKEIISNARSLVKELMNLGDQYEILFLQGGASLQFCMVPYNLSTSTESPLYLQTGKWADNAYIEALKLSNPKLIATSKDKNYTYIPTDFEVDKDSPYLHITSNNTIYGTQMKSFPKTEVPLVCDMSSDILSRDIDYNQFDLIYAGAQKNIGSAGTTLVIVNREILRKDIVIPSYLSYQVHIDKYGVFNTSPVFAIYTAYLNLLWLKEKGGVKAMDKLNKQKSDLLYQEIDRNPLFIGVAEKEFRSDMNITFILKEESLKEYFNQLCLEANISGIQGHRSVGGYRASLYNALPIDSVEVLVDCMKRLEIEA